MKIAIHSPSGQRLHSTSWAPVVENYLHSAGVGFEPVDCTRGDVIARLGEFDALFWHVDNYNPTDMLMARDVLWCARRMGLAVFPDFEESWHFDDKIAQMYALQSVRAPIPASHVFYNAASLEEWLASGGAEFPLVAKLRTGSGAHNVKLLADEADLRRYASRMWGRGFSPAPSLAYKASSQIRSARDWATIVKRARRIPEFLRTLARAADFPHERGYVYLQEFVPNDGFDIKVVVVGDRLTGVVRPVRSGDFRASGGGTLIHDRRMITPGIRDAAFAASDALGMRCMGYDFVVDSRTGCVVIVEMSYGFNHTALMDAGGWFDRAGEWHDQPLNAPEEIVRNMIEKL